MRFNSLELTDNNRLLLAMIKKINLTYTEDCQITIGTNGSGKSTVMRETSPLPAIADDYMIGGGKVARVTHKGEKYTATSIKVTEKGWKHSLIHEEDETELNPGGTRAVQKQLVEEIFGLTEEIFDILVGDTVFTNMSPALRREWILSFSGSDLEYAMEVYKKLAVKQREAQTLQRHYAGRLATELGNQIKDDEIEHLRIVTKQSTDSINQLMLEKDGTRQPSHQIQRQIDDITTEVQERLEDIIHSEHIIDGYFGGEVKDLADVGIVLQDMSAQKEGLKQHLKSLYHRADRMREFLRTLESSGAGGVAELEEVTKHKQEEVDDWMGLIHHHHTHTDAEALCGLLSGQIGIITDLLHSIPDNTSGEYTPDRYMRLVNEQKSIMVDINQIDSKSKDIEHQLYHLQNVSAVDCPDCHSHFTPGASDSQITALRDKLSAFGNSRHQRESLIEELDLKLTEQKAYQQKVMDLNQFIDRMPKLKPLWNLIAPLDVYRGGNAKAVTVAMQYLNDLELSCDILKHEAVIRANKDIIESISQLTQGQNVVNEAELTSLDQEISNTLRDIEQLDARFRTLKQFESQAQSLTMDAEQYHQRVYELRDLTIDYLLSLRNECIEEDIREQQIVLANVQAKLHSSLTGKALIDELRRNKEIVDEDLKCLSVMEAKLSPKNGLIATHIKTFFDQFIEQMNAIIAEVWTYPMQIMVSDIVADGMNCKFPVVVESVEHGVNAKVTSKDVAKTSSSQIDIINFAFRIVAMMCLGLEEYPLYLDEVGIRMDEKHRDRFNAFIERYMEAKQGSQMFMISHYVAMHGIFTQAEICLLDKQNIMNLPDFFNRHVEITQAA